MRCHVRGCAMEASFHFAQIESRRLIAEKDLCDTHAESFFAEFRATVSIGGGTAHVAPGGVCVDLEAIAYNNRGDPPGCIYAHEVGGERRFAMIVDGWAWWALMAHIKHEPAPYPRTHVAWIRTISELGGELQDVLVDRTSDADWWLGKLHIVKDGRAATVDVRAADAYTLAVICDAPIFVTERALDRYADSGEGTRDK